MKTTISPLLLLLACALPLSAGEAPAETIPPVPPTPPTTAPDGKLLLEFRGARLGQVLDHLSKEAGFVIANPVELAAPITLVAKQPLTPLEAVEALNSVLIDLGHVAIVRGKTLHVVTLPTARQQNLPVHVGSDPDQIPDTDRMVTQVMPVQLATAKDLAENLQPLLNPASATLSANESSNVLILTDTQAHVRRIAAIIKAIDQSISGEQQVKVFHLAHADAEKVAQIINNLYGRQNAGGNNQNRNNNPFAAFNPFAGGNQGGGRGNNNNNSNANAGAGSRTIEVVAAADNGTNSLVIRASSDALDSLAAVIKELDVDNSARDGVLLYRVRNGKAEDLATSLNNLFQGTQSATGVGATQNRNTTQNRTVAGGNQARTTQAATPARAAAPAAGAAAGGSDSSLDLSGQVRVVADATSNSVMVLSPERNFDRLRKILVDLDQPVKQVLVRVLVAEVTLERGLDLGVELEGVNPAANTADSRIFSDFNLFDSTLGMNGFLLETTDFRAAIRALATNTSFDVLSRPYILTTDNREAIVNVSQEVPVINGSRTDQNNNVTTTFDRRDVGIILTVTPQINSEGRVVLDVSQELSALSDQAIPVAANVDAPIINKRTMTTRVVVEHGQTAVVGGLVKDQLSETVRKIPLLGDIPIIGALFRRTESTKSQTELLVFLTPQVVQKPEDLADLSRQLRGEMQRLDAAVEKGLLQRHLDQLTHLKVGEPLKPAAATEGDAK